MKKIIVELLTSSLASFIGFVVIAEFHWLILSKFSPTCNEHIFTSVFIGLPLGGIIGLYLLKKFIFKEKKVFTIFRLIGCVTVSLLLGLLGIVSLDFTRYIIFLLPIFASIGFIICLKK